MHYTFTPKAPIADINTQAWVERDQIIQLANSWYPGPRYLEKYAIVKGKTFPAVLKVLSQGTCSPYVIDLPDLDLTDYFEFDRAGSRLATSLMVTGLSSSCH